MKKDNRVLSYKPNEWEKAFVMEKDNLSFLLPQFKINIEHIGATSISNCRSFRNVDILVSVNNFADIYTIAMLLGSKEYKELPDLGDMNCRVLVKKHKVNGCGVTVRVVEHASITYNRIVSFKLLLQGSFDKTQAYNYFRETLFKKVNHNIAEYNRIKYDYINSYIDEMCKFE